MDLFQANEMLFDATEQFIENKNRYLYMDEEGNLNIALSYSLISKMFSYGNEMDFCPRYLYEVVMCRNVIEPPSLPMLKGLFAETLMIGGTAHGALYDLPRKTVPLKAIQEAIKQGLNPDDVKGEKTIDQIRIEEQAALFPSKCRQYGVSIFKEGEAKNVQVPVQSLWTSSGHIPNCKIWVQATVDIISGFVYQTQKFDSACLDLKMTKDRDGQGEKEQRGEWSKFNYGDPANLDHLQPNLTTLITGLPFFYWVWDYRKDNPGEKIIPHFTTRIEFAELNEIIRKSALNVAEMDRDNYPTRPHPRPCKKCPMAFFNGGQCRDAKQWEDYER